MVDLNFSRAATNASILGNPQVNSAMNSGSLLAKACVVRPVDGDTFVGGLTP